MFKGIKIWWRKRQYERLYVPMTVATDYSPFYHSFNQRQMLWHGFGRKWADNFAHDWVDIHTCGQACVHEGHIHWPDGKYENGEL